MKLVAELDGNCICIHREDFVNLMESPCMFIELTPAQIHEVKALQSDKIPLTIEVLEPRILDGKTHV